MAENRAASDTNFSVGMMEPSIPSPDDTVGARVTSSMKPCCTVLPPSPFRLRRTKGEPRQRGESMMEYWNIGTMGLENR